MINGSSYILSMKIQNPDNFLQAAKWPSIVLIRSSYPERTVDFLNRLACRFFSTQNTNQWHFEKLQASQTPLENLIYQLSVFDLFAPKRAIHVLGVESYNTLSKREQILIEKLIVSPNTILIFEAKVLEEKFWWFAHAAKFGAVIDLDLNPGFVQNYAKRLGLSLGAQEWDWLKILVGDDESIQMRALEKLHIALLSSSCTTPPPTLNLSMDALNQYVAPVAMGDAFALLHSIFAKNTKEVNSILQKLKQNNEAPLRFLGLLAWQTRLVVKARVLLDEKAPIPKIQSTLRQYGKSLQSTLSVAKRDILKIHLKRLAALADLDHALKQHSTPTAWLFLEQAIFQIFY